MTPNQLKDDLIHQGMRTRLVKLLAEKGITAQNVLNAIGKVPRHFFFNTAFIDHAYEDKAFPIAAGQTISQPYTVAFQTQLLQLQKGEKVLEIGTGSGYQTCILMEILGAQVSVPFQQREAFNSGKVFTIERQKELYDKTKLILPKMGYSPKMFYGDGYKGLEAFAPFDKILVTAGAPFIPEPLKQQLKAGGRLVIPVGEGELQVMTLIEKSESLEFTETTHGIFRFVPLLSEKNRNW